MRKLGSCDVPSWNPSDHPIRNDSEAPDVVWNRKLSSDSAKDENLKSLECHFVAPISSHDELGCSRIPSYLPHQYSDFSNICGKDGNKRPDGSPEYDNVPATEICEPRNAQRLRLTFCTRDRVNPVDDLSLAQHSSDHSNNPVDDVIDAHFSQLIGMLQRNGMCNTPVRQNSRKVAERLRNTDSRDIVSPTVEIGDSLTLTGDVFAAPLELSFSTKCPYCTHCRCDGDDTVTTLREKRNTFTASDTVNTDTTTTTTATTTTDSMDEIIPCPKLPTVPRFDSDGSAFYRSESTCDAICVASPPLALTFRKYRLTTQPETTV